VISKYIPKKIISASEAAAIHHASLGYPITKISVVPNGYTETINSNMSPDLLEIRHKSYFLIGMVARFDQQKDHKNLFAALSLLKTKNIDFECILVGTGMTSLNTHLITMIENYNIQDKIQLLGQRDDVDSVMKILDLHVLSSLGEAFPNVLVEAMLGETLCVSTDVGDARYILNGQGWIVEPENPKALHSAIIAAFNLFSTDKNNWVTKSKMVKQYARNRFSIDNMVKQYNEVWNG
jgi:glycosyltransferase involved in cell wall biosynthesis